MHRIIFILVLMISSAARAEPQLLMVEQDGCHWCARWHEEIGAIYPKTWEGRAAPLRSLDLRAKLPSDVTLDRTAVFTPTFVLLIDGQETGRLEGYAGDEFFWVLLDDLLQKAGITPAPSG